MAVQVSPLAGAVPTGAAGAGGTTLDDPETGGLEPAFRQIARWGGGAATVLAGSYALGRTLILPSNLDLRFQGPLIRRTGIAPAFRTAPGAKNIRCSGSVTFDGGGQRDRLFYVAGAQAVSYAAETTVQNMGLPFSLFMVRGSTEVHLLGPFRSTDSAIVRVVDSSRVEVANIDCRYARDPGEVPVGVFGSAPMTDIELHHIHIDGGGFRPRPMIDLSPDPGAPHIQNVRIHDISLENPPTTTDFHDGIDIDRAEGVTVENVTGVWLNLVVCLMSSRAVVRGVRGADCWGPALQVGDPTCMKEDVHDVEVEDCHAQDCGRGYSGPAGAGMGVYVTPGRSVANVVFRGCTSKDTRSVQKFGFGIMPGASGVRLEGCDFSGIEGSILNRAGPQALSAR